LLREIQAALVETAGRTRKLAKREKKKKESARADGQAFAKKNQIQSWRVGEWKLIGRAKRVPKKSRHTAGDALSKFARASERPEGGDQKKKGGAEGRPSLIGAWLRQMERKKKDKAKRPGSLEKLRCKNDRLVKIKSDGELEDWEGTPDGERKESLGELGPSPYLGTGLAERP